MSDLISRERLINEWDDLGRRYAMPTTPIHKRAFREFPSADVRENKGEWIELPKAFNANENPCECSKCGHILSFMNGYPKSNFCPNCGADMRGVSE